MSDGTVDVPQTIDAHVWATEFMRLFGERREDIGQGLMLAWFANAIMRGFDVATRREQVRCDALRTQARELARALKESRREICPFMYGSPQESAWLQADKDYQCAQAVLKEGA